MKDDERARQLYTVARMRYLDNPKKNNTQIANALKTSGTQITRLLQEAEKEGVIQFLIKPPHLENLQDQLLHRFEALKETVVVPGAVGGNSLLESVGKAAADYFDHLIDELHKQRADATEQDSRIAVGISGGNTINEMIQALPERYRPITICPDALIGKGPQIPENGDPLVLISRLWEKSGRNENSAFYVTVPPFERGTPDDARKEYRHFLKRPKVQEVWQRMHETEVIFSSVGAVAKRAHPNSLGRRTLLRLLGSMGINERRLQKERIVGEISYSMFDANGDTKPQWEWFMTLGVDHFKTMAADYPNKRVVVVAGAPKKDVVLAVLKGKMCNVLITDDATAEGLLKG